jgi:hypothetical protein
MLAVRHDMLSCSDCDLVHCTPYPALLSRSSHNSSGFSQLEICNNAVVRYLFHDRSRVMRMYYLAPDPFKIRTKIACNALITPDSTIGLVMIGCPSCVSTNLNLEMKMPVTDTTLVRHACQLFFLFIIISDTM